MTDTKDLERLILKGLVSEWNLIKDLYRLDGQGRFFCPVFSLGDSTSFIGKWVSLTCQIIIQKDFALKKPFDEVRQVLKHEMAHQYADTVLNKSKNESAHGESFKKACRILRIPPSSIYRYAPDIKDLNINDKITKIKKLFSLAASSNQNEAETAMNKAFELMVKYNFDSTELKNEEHVSKTLGEAGLRHFKEFYHLSTMLSEFYFVYPVWIPCFVTKKGKTGKILEISGRASNVDIASYVYDYVIKYIDRTWNDFKNGEKLSRYKKSDFAVGVIAGFSSKLRTKDVIPRQNRSLPIAVKSDPQLQEYLKWYYPRLKNESKNTSVDRSVFGEGEKKGKELVISKGINTGSCDKKYLIGR